MALPLATIARAMPLAPPTRGIPISTGRGRLGERAPIRSHGPGRHAGAAMNFASIYDHGFARVVNVAGGIDAWSLSADPSVPRY